MESKFFGNVSWEKAAEWSLVLTALNIPHIIKREGESFRLVVPEEEHQRAISELSLYEWENRKTIPQEEAPQTKGLEGIFWTTLVLTGLLSLTFDPSFSFLRDQGLGDAQAILSGKWWLAVTALTLHADPAHLLGNMLFGGLFVAILRAFWPAGLTWFAVLLVGVMGNLLNCLFQRDHLFLGASTAVFGALGLICGLRLRARDPKTPLLSLGAGLALLGLLGTAGENTDLLAHFLGFGVGVLVGFFLSPCSQRLLPLDHWFKIAAVIIPLLAWYKALYPFSFLAKRSIFNY